MSLEQKLEQKQLTAFQLLCNCRDAAMPKIAETVAKVANARAILILGESGTGKDVIARALHEKGSRSQQALIVLDCANLRGDTIKSELFGHEAGAFTGAQNRHIGAFEKADGGTVFLDEIGDIELDEQSRLLRVLNDGSFSRLGSSSPLNTNFRLIAATNKDLQGMVRNRTFREDLFYRLQMITIDVPPLRERMEDIPRLANHFIDQLIVQFSGSVGTKMLRAEAEQELMKYSWPGNVRELKNVIERGILIAGENEFVEAGDLRINPFDLKGRLSLENKGLMFTQIMEELIVSIQKANPGEPVMEIVKKLATEAAIRLNHGQLTNASLMLGINPATLYRKRKKYGLLGGKLPLTESGQNPFGN